MTIGERIRARLREAGVSQSELARRVNVHQSTINGLVNGDQRSSTHLHLIARELGTTPAYLTGEIDDPEANAPPRPPEPSYQTIMLPVALPSEAALTRMFEGLLAASHRLHGAELAHELARRLPKALGIARSGVTTVTLADDEAPAATENRPTDHLAAMRA